MELQEAKDLLIEAYNEYSDASYFNKWAKGKRKDQYQRTMTFVYDRVKNIFSSCPELWGFVEEGFFSPNYFESDLRCLIEELKQLDC